MDKTLRRKTIKQFREGKLDLLVSTELGSRGLDIENVDRVINYNMPKDIQNYIHRAGRTARAGKDGLVINLFEDRDEKVLEKIRQLGTPEGLQPDFLANQPRKRAAATGGGTAPKKKLSRKENERRRESARRRPAR
jgi:superfamily II DNA/RNA helicase